jgi:hypothetical protein
MPQNHMRQATSRELTAVLNAHYNAAQNLQQLQKSSHIINRQQAKQGRQLLLNTAHLQWQLPVHSTVPLALSLQQFS